MKGGGNGRDFAVAFRWRVRFACHHYYFGEHLMRPVIYISGPITNKDPEQERRNVEIADDAFFLLTKTYGFAAYCPHLTWYSRHKDEYTIDDWMDNDLSLVEASHAVLRIQPSVPSTGADRECAHASRCGIPVFEAISELEEWKSNGWSN
jgi:hypothetical protein